jgi:hypothetical protein
MNIKVESAVFVQIALGIAGVDLDMNLEVGDWTLHRVKAFIGERVPLLANAGVVRLNGKSQ